MNGPTPHARPRPDSGYTGRGSLRRWALAGAGVCGYGLVVRPRVLTWGTTVAEAHAVLPGDELVPQAQSCSTMATTLPAPPARVWPWLVQMGCNRGGWYSWDRLDNGGVPSADRIHPQWQSLSVGQRIDSVPSGRAWFTVARLVPNQVLVLRARLNLLSARPTDCGDAHPSRWFVDSIWGFHLSETADHRTRLVVRTRGRAHPRWLARIMDVLFWENAHLIMQLRQFGNLRARVRIPT